jgi:hypothetical protein
MTTLFPTCKLIDDKIILNVIELCPGSFRMKLSYLVFHTELFTLNHFVVVFRVNNSNGASKNPILFSIYFYFGLNELPPVGSA